MLHAFKRRIDPRRYNGATLLGLKGIVVKSHGGADALAFAHALQKAHAEVDARRARPHRAAHRRDAASRRAAATGAAPRAPADA